MATTGPMMIVNDVKAIGAGVDQSFPADFEVKAAIMIASHVTALDTFTADAQVAIGGTDGTRDRGVATWSEDGQGTSDAHRRQADKILTILGQGTGAMVAECSWKTFDDDGSGTGGPGLTVTWDTNDGNAYRLTVILFGGDEVTNTHCGRFTARTTTGTQDETAPGFQIEDNKGVLFWWGSQNGNEDPPPAIPDTQIQAGYLQFGFATQADDAATNEHKNVVALMENAVGTSNTFGGTLRDHLGYTMKGGVATADGSWHVESWLANGFRQHWVAPVATVAYNIDYLLIKGGSWLVSPKDDFQFDTTPPNNGDDDTLTGLGTAAKGCIAISASDTGNGETRFSIGASYNDGLGGPTYPRACYWMGDADNQGTTQADSNVTHSDVLELIDAGTPTKVEGADVVTWGDDGAVFDWELAEAAANLYAVLLCGDAPSDETPPQVATSGRPITFDAELDPVLLARPGPAGDAARSLLASEEALEKRLKE